MALSNLPKGTISASFSSTPLPTAAIHRQTAAQVISAISKRNAPKSASAKSRRSWADFTRWTATAAGTASSGHLNACGSAKATRPQAPPQAIAESYAKNITDEFIEPTNIVDANEKPIATIDDGDAVIFFNFRGDRTREITRAFVEDDFKGFDRKAKPDVYYVCLTEYDATIPAPVAFPKAAENEKYRGGIF